MMLLFFALSLTQLLLLQAYEYESVFNFNQKSCETKQIPNLGPDSSLTMSIASSFTPPLAIPISLSFLNNGIDDYGVEESQRLSLYDSYEISKGSLCQAFGGLTLFNSFYPISSAGLQKNGLASSSSLYNAEETLAYFSMLINYQPCFSCLHEQTIFKISQEGDADELSITQVSVNATHVSYRLKKNIFSILMHVSIENYNPEQGHQIFLQINFDEIISLALNINNVYKLRQFFLPSDFSNFKTSKLFLFPLTLTKSQLVFDEGLKNTPLISSFPYFSKNNLGMIHSVKISKAPIATDDISRLTQESSPVPYYNPLSVNMKILLNGQVGNFSNSPEYYTKEIVSTDLPVVTLPIFSPPSWRSNLRQASVYLSLSSTFGKAYFMDGTAINKLTTLIPYDEVSKGFSFRYRPSPDSFLSDKVDYFVSNTCYGFGTNNKDCINPLVFNSTNGEEIESPGLDLDHYFNPNSISERNSTSSSVSFTILPIVRPLTAKDITFTFFTNSEVVNFEYRSYSSFQNAAAIILSNCPSTIQFYSYDASNNKIPLDCSSSSVEVPIPPGFNSAKVYNYNITGLISFEVPGVNAAEMTETFQFQLKDNLGHLSLHHTANLIMTYPLSSAKYVFTEDSSNNLINLSLLVNSEHNYMIGVSNFPSLGEFSNGNQILPPESDTINVVGEFNELTKDYGMNLTYKAPEDFFTIPSVTWNHKTLSKPSLGFKVYLVESTHFNQGTPFSSGSSKEIDIRNQNQATTISFHKPPTKNFRLKTYSGDINNYLSKPINETDSVLILDNFELVDPDQGVDPIKVHIVTTKKSFVYMNLTGLEEDILHTSSPMSTLFGTYCSNPQFNWFCHGTLNNLVSNTTFIGTPSAVNELLNRMSFITQSDELMQFINITLYDGVGPNCFYHNTPTQYNNHCYMESLSIQIDVTPPSSIFDSGSSSFSLIYTIVLIVGSCLLGLYCIKKYCWKEKTREKESKKSNGDKDAQSPQIIFVGMDQLQTPPHSSQKYTNIPNYSPSPFSSPARPLLNNLTPLYQSPMNTQANAAMLGNQCMNFTNEDINNAFAQNLAKNKKKTKETPKKSKTSADAATISFPQLNNFPRSFTSSNAGMLSDIELASFHHKLEADAYNNHLFMNHQQEMAKKISKSRSATTASAAMLKTPEKKTKKALTSSNAAEVYLTPERKTKKSLTSQNAAMVTTPDTKKSIITSPNAAMFYTPERKTKKSLTSTNAASIERELSRTISNGGVRFYDTSSNAMPMPPIFYTPQMQQQMFMTSQNAAFYQQPFAMSPYEDDIELGSNQNFPPQPPVQKTTKKKSKAKESPSSQAFFDPRVKSNTSASAASLSTKPKKTKKTSTCSSAASLSFDEDDYIRMVTVDGVDRRYDTRTKKILD